VKSIPPAGLLPPETANQIWPTLAKGAYVVGEVIGEGGTAIVLAATRACDGEPVAIKVLRPESHFSPAAHKRFETEAQIGAAVDHPALIRVDDCFKEHDRTFIVMERMAGTVTQWVNIHGVVPPALAVVQLIRVLEGLEMAHKAGVIHRDIKPENLLINSSGDLVLSDFGVAQLRDENTIFTATGVVLGTVAFMAPEQKTDTRGVGPAADIYALGASLAWMLTCRLPFDLYVNDRREEALAALHPALSSVIDKACRYHPKDRYESAAQMACALLEILEVFPGAQRPQHFQGFDSDGVSHSPFSKPLTLGAGSVANRATGPWIFGAALVLFAAVGITGVLGADTPQSTAGDATEGLLVDMDIRNLEPCDGGIQTHRLERRMGPRETQGAAAADLDGDGRTDLVFLNQMDQNISIYWGSAYVPLSPEAPPPMLLDVGRGNGNPAIGDVNEDGRLDLVIPIPDSAELSIFIGDGNRGFEAMPPIFQGGGPRHASLVDWNGDGHLDLVFRLEDGLAMRAGDGRGGFSEHRTLISGTNLAAVLSFEGKNGPEVWYSLEIGQGKYELMRLVGDGRGGLAKRTQVAPAHAPPWGMGVDSAKSEVYLWGTWRWGPLARLSEGPSGWSLCQVGRLENGTPRGVADLNGDGLIDVFGYTTCAGCESNHEVSLTVP